MLSSHRYLTRTDCLVGPATDRPPPRLCDLHANDLDRPSAGNHPLRRRDREAGDAQVDQQRDGEAVRQHDRLGAALGSAGEQSERAAAVGREVVAAGGMGHGANGLDGGLEPQGYHAAVPSAAIEGVATPQKPGAGALNRAGLVYPAGYFAHLLHTATVKPGFTAFFTRLCR